MMHPFLWGSKRTGPDLHRVGGKYLDSWHYYHMNEPQSMSSGSIMPSYPWLISQRSEDFSGTSAKIRAMRKLGVPYAEQSDQNIQDSARKRGKRIAASLAKEGIKTMPDQEIVALIAYLQRLGTDIKTETANQ